MTEQDKSTYRLLWMLGAAMTVPFILLSGPFAGYCLGQFVLVKYFKLPEFLIPVFVVLGFIASATHVAQLIKRIMQSESNKS